jgi:flagellar hook-associated protein FlgK
MGVYSISDSALAGLQIAQAGILVTSQNVAGTTVEGYSRRSASAVVNSLAPNSLMLNGTSFAIEGFTRQYSSVIGSQLLSQQAKASYSDTLVQHTAILDSIIGNKSTSLSGALNEFFNAMGTYAADPSSHALAANITNKANIVSQRMVGMATLVNDIASDAQTSLEDTVLEVNTIIPALAEINNQIVKASNRGISYPSADLLDERDRLLSQLQKLMGGQSLINSDGTATHNVSGLSLIERGVANQVSITADGDHVALRFNTQNGTSKTVMQTVQDLSGGQAGALLKIANEFVPDVQKRLDSIALGLVKAANSASTTDSEGKPKTAIFGFQVGGNTYYDLNDDYTSLIPDIASDVDMQDLYRSLSNSVSTDSDLVNGDTFTIGTDTLEITSITAKSSVAAGEYTLTRVDDDQLKIENQYGKSQIIYLSDLVASDSSTLDFNQFGITIQLQNNSSDTEYSAENIVDSLDGRSITISGIANELYYYGLNASKFISIAPSDPAYYFDGGSENISADSANTLQKLSSVFGISVSNLVSDVGIQVSEWTYTQKADSAVLSNLEDQRNEISGVNLDEEAANLLKYQQLYSASTKVLQTGNQMFNSLLMIMN